MDKYTKFEKLLLDSGINILFNHPISCFTSFKIGGNAKYIVKPKDLTEILSIIHTANDYHIDYYIIGNGSNILASDKGYNGILIVLTELTEIKLIDETTIQCQAGVNLSRLCRFALDHSLSGLEFAFGIPATVGGAVYMNAGAYGGEIQDVIESCEYLDEQGETKTYKKEDMKFSYRHSIFTDTKKIILSATFKLDKEEKIDIKAKMDDFMSRRKEKQPLEYPSAGSTFKRPKDAYAAALIEQCGLKGAKIGGAEVSTKHSGFIINKENATCEDVLKLIEFVQKTVYEQTGYILECEVKRL